jgi:hypothetical protein
MTTTTVTNIGYTGTVQNASVLGEYGIPVNAYLWGAGGGSTSQAAGNAGGYSKVYFVAKPGDILTVAVGQGGGRGGSDINGWTPSGFSGAAYSGLLFNTRFPPPGQDTAVVPYGQGQRNTSTNYTSFLSQWGVWDADQSVQTFTRTYTINFPTTANVIFQMVASTYGRVYLDGVLIVEGAGRSNTPVYDDTINKAFVKVTAGNHTITIEADGNGAPPNPNSANPNAIGVIFGTGDLTTYAGGRGGQTYPPQAGVQGTAGGGGGATILSLNGVVIGVAAGGAGGATRPAVDTSTDFRYNNGQDGQDVNTINDIYENRVGGGGGGGGGLFAGQGGSAGGGAPRIGGTAGTNGTSLGDEQAQPVQRTPYINDYYPYGGVAEGGASGTTATRYVGSTATDPFHSVIVPGTSGYYVRRIIETVTQYIIGYSVVVNGTVVYQSDGGSATAPPTTLAVQQGFVGYSFEGAYFIDGVPVIEKVECFSFDYVTSTFTNGGNGFVALEYQTGGGGAVKDSGSWKPIQTTYVKDAGTWKTVQTTYINVNGIWKPTQGAPVPTFTQFNGAFAPASRNFGSRLTPPPPPPAPDYGGGGGDTGYGGSFMF